MSSNSRSSSSGGLRPDYKIPKVDPTNPPPPQPPTPATASEVVAMDAAPTDITKDTTANEEGIVEGGEQYDPLESFTPDMDDAPFSAYASAAKGKKKARMSYPYLGR